MLTKTNSDQHARQRYVFAHFMVGNTYPYTVNDWIEDIVLANAHNIDGFALNVGREEWQRDRVVDCYHAVSLTGLSFKLFMSYDMTSIPSNSQDDIHVIRDYHKAVAHHPNSFLYGGKVVVSTFSGENCTFGQPSMNHAWQYAKKELNAIAPVHFIPSIFIDPARYPQLSCLDGIFNWNGSWPAHLAPHSPRRDIHLPKLDSDRDHLHHLGRRTFMGAVSPWFFTHYGPDTWNKNWIYRGDDWLFIRRWEKLISMRQHIDIVQVISWNDYGESHYIGPIKGAQPNSQAWVDGFPHTAWLHLNAYYAKAFKDGVFPRVEEDQIFIWGRPHPKDAEAADNVSRPTNWELTDDIFWVVVFCKAPATVTLSSGSESGTSHHTEVGVTKLSHPLQVGGGMRAVMMRAGAIVAECNPKEFRFEENPEVYNFNVFVAMQE